MKASLGFGALLISLATLAASCGGSNDPEFLAGQAGKLQIQGTVDGTSVDITEPNVCGLSQDNTGGEFDSGSAGLPDATGSTIKLVWQQGLVNGQVGSATGTLTLGSGALAGQALCAGSDTVVRIEDTGFQFNLNGLHSGAACDHARAGSLRGWCAFAASP